MTCIAISGPSGSGKSTLLSKFLLKNHDLFAFSVSHTTRKPRRGEVNGKDYHFTNRRTVETMISDKMFVESAEFSGNFYGTSKKAIENVHRDGKTCILDVELNGVRSLRELENFSCKFVLIVPPSLTILRERLENRKTESRADIELRMKSAQEDLIIIESNEHLFDATIVNDDFDVAYDTLSDLLFKLSS